MEQENKEAKCHKCGYKWETKSLMIFVSCPSCGTKVKIRKVAFIDKLPGERKDGK